MAAFIAFNEGPVSRLIQGRSKDLGGFQVRRLLPVAGQQMVGPWIFFDHMGPAHFAAGDGIKVRPHPHINLATVTYLFSGEMLHRDSLGSEQVIQPGAINLMVAGSGIVHSERERPEVTAQPHELHGLQLWLALPDALEEIAPAFYHVAATDIPAVRCGKSSDVSVRVLIGSAYGVTSPVPQFARTLYVEALLQTGQTLELPEADERALYVASGAVSIDEQHAATSSPRHINAGELAILASTPLQICASEPSRIALIGGETVGKRYIDWNFVSSRPERIAQAKADWQQGRFAKVPGDDAEFIPLP